MWIKHVQQEILQQLSNKVKQDNNKLNLQPDQDGIVRCHGRLLNIDEVETTNPIYLPKKSYLTQLIIKDCHERLFHAGASHTLSYVRRTYWIPPGRTKVRSTLLNCGICKRFQGGPFKMPKMSPWPISKITRSAPFSYTGLDYMGPLYTKEASQRTKVWICLFTCVTTRALHLEIVGDMTADQFLMALRRFIARRGTPTEVTCDNAKQFKAAKRATDQAWSYVLSDQSVSKCEPRIGEIVHVKEGLPRGKWKLGRIEELIISNDGETRAAKIRTAHGHVLKRPLNLLYPMELSTFEPNTSMNNVSNTVNDEEDVKNEHQEILQPRQSKRTASKNAKLKIQLQVKDEL